MVDAMYVTKAYVSSNVPLFLWGSQGVGKSSMVYQLAQELTEEAQKVNKDAVPWGFIDLRLATQEVSDLIGMPHRDMETKRTIWLKPEWFPKPGTRGILFLDEFNRAQRDVIQCAFQLVLDRRLHTHVLPEGWVVVAAGNYFGKFDVRELDEAMMGRFGHLDLETSHHAVCNYGIEHNWSTQVVDFLRSNPTFLKHEEEENKDTAEIQKYQAIPDPRRWEFVSRLLKDGVKVFPQNDRGTHLTRMMLQGMVGEAAAVAFLKYKERLPSFEDIINGKVPVKALDEIKNPAKKEATFQKVYMEAVPFLKITEFSEEKLKRAVRLFAATPRTDLLAGVLQRIAELDNEKKIDVRWTAGILTNPKVEKIFEFLLKELPAEKEKKKSK